MAKKMKSDDPRLDELDRAMCSTFCSAANSLSQIYTQAMNQQKVAFQAGECHAVEKLYQWILRQHEEGSRLTAADIVAYLQNEIDYGGEDSSMSPTLQFPQQHPQSTMHFTNSSIQTSGLSGQATVGPAARTNQSDQTKNLEFSNAFSSPVCRSLQPYHLAQGGGYFPNDVLPMGFGARNHEVDNPNQNRDSNSFSTDGSAMDMHSDSQPHDF